MQLNSLNFLDKNLFFQVSDFYVENGQDIEFFINFFSGWKRLNLK